MKLYIYLGIILLLLDLSCAVSIIFVEKRDSTTTWAWLLVLSIFPFLGFILYVCFGQNIAKEKIFNKKAKIDKHKLNTIIDKINNNSYADNPTYNYIDLIKMNFSSNGCIYSNNNTVKTYTNGEYKFKDLFDDIEKASSFINIQYYIFRCDDLGMKLLNLLGKKISQGIEVRLLVDGMGSNSIRKDNINYIKDRGIKFAFFFPSLMRYLNLRINYRNHRKIVVIDGKIGYVGGFNVGNEYVNRGKQFDFWRDTHLRISGDAVSELQKRFALDWEYAAKESIDKKQTILTHLTQSPDDSYVLNDLFNDSNKSICAASKNKLKHHKAFDNVGIQIVSSGPDNLEEYIRNSYLKIINNAKKNIYIQTPYLVLDDPMITCLKLAASSGVDVRIMVPKDADHFFMAYALSSSIDSLIYSGVKFYQYKKGFIHAKTIAADSSVVSIGTANLDIRSFKLNFEINAIIYDSEMAKYNEDIFLNDMEDCDFLTLQQYKNRSFKTKLYESLIKLISPLL